MAILKKQKPKDPTQERLDKLSPIAQNVIKLITDANLPVGDHNAHDNNKFNNVAKEVIGQMLDNDVKYVDKEFLFQLVLQPFDEISQIVTKSLKESFNKTEQKLFGKDFRDVTLGDIDKILK